MEKDEREEKLVPEDLVRDALEIATVATENFKAISKEARQLYLQTSEFKLRVAELELELALSRRVATRFRMSNLLLWMTVGGLSFFSASILLFPKDSVAPLTVLGIGFGVIAALITDCMARYMGA